MENYKTMEELYEESNENRFKITNPQGAAWAINRMKEAEKDKAMWTDHYKNQMEMAVVACDRTIDSMSLFLEEYFETLPKKETKTQFSYDGLPGAKLIRKKESKTFKREDETFLQFLKSGKREEYIKVKESPDWSAYKKIIQEGEDGTLHDLETGEIIQGVSVEITPSRFTVQLKEEDNER